MWGKEHSPQNGSPGFLVFTPSSTVIGRVCCCFSAPPGHPKTAVLLWSLNLAAPGDILSCPVDKSICKPITDIVFDCNIVLQSWLQQETHCVEDLGSPWDYNSLAVPGGGGGDCKDPWHTNSILQLASVKQTTQAPYNWTIHASNYISAKLKKRTYTYDHCRPNFRTIRCTTLC